MSKGSPCGDQANALLAAFGVGAIVGAAFAVLYAPLSGKDTRRLLTRRGRKMGERAGEALDGAVDVVEKKVRSHAETAGKAIGDAKEALHEKKERLGAALEEGRRTLHAQ